MFVEGCLFSNQSTANFCKSLRSLDLSGGYGRTIILPFLEGLKNNTQLKSLKINGNALGDKGCSTELEQYNDIMFVAGAEAIAVLMRNNTAVTSMEIDDNRFLHQLFLSNFHHQVYFIRFPVNTLGLPHEQIVIKLAVSTCRCGESH